MSAGNTSLVLYQARMAWGEARRDNAMATRVSFAAAKVEDERDERNDEGGARPYAVRRDDNLTRCRYPSRLGSQGGRPEDGLPVEVLIEQLPSTCAHQDRQSRRWDAAAAAALYSVLVQALARGTHRRRCSEEVPVLAPRMEHVAIVRSFIAALPNKNLTTQAERRNFCQTCDGVPTLRFWAFASLPKRSSQNGVRSTTSTAKVAAARVLWCSDLQRVAADLVLVHPGRR